MLLQAPKSLSVEKNIAFGRYNRLIENTDVSMWQKGFIDRRLKRKGWIYSGIYNAEIALGFAIADSGYIGKCFVYLYHFASKTFIEESAQSPFYFDHDFMPSLNSNWEFKNGGKLWQIEAQNNQLNFLFKSKKLSVNFSLNDFENGMSVLAKAAERPFNFTFKNAAIMAKGEVKFNNTTIEINGKDAVIDFTLGFPPRNTFWNWASLTGRTVNDDIVGINIVAHFNQGLENVLFLNGELIPLSEASFNYKKPAEKTPWHITTEDQLIDMTFTPQGSRKDNINVGFLKHQFIQPFGTFEGLIKLKDQVLPFKAFGVVEEHHSLW